MNDLVNGINISKVVTTNTDQNLTATYKFLNKIILEKNLYVSGLINDINVSYWDKRSLKTDTKIPELINNLWKIDNVTFKGEIKGKSFVNNFDIKELDKTVEDKVSFKKSVEANFVVRIKQNE